MAKRTAGTARCSMQIGTRSNCGKNGTFLAGNGDPKPKSEAGKIKATAGSVIYVIHQVADMFPKRSLVPAHNGSQWQRFSSGPWLAWRDKNIAKSFQVWTKSSKSVLRVHSPTRNCPEEWSLIVVDNVKKLPLCTDIDDVYKLYHTQFSIPASMLDKQMVSVGICILYFVKIVLLLFCLFLPERWIWYYVWNILNFVEVTF